MPWRSLGSIEFFVPERTAAVGGNDDDGDDDDDDADDDDDDDDDGDGDDLSLIHISEPTRQEAISYAVFCLKKKNQIM